MAVPPTGKTILRSAMRVARTAFVAGLPAEERARLEAALAAVLAHHLPAGVVAAYRATGSEIAPGPASLWPRVDRDGPLTFHGAPIILHRPGFGGILEPPATAPRGVPDIVIVPLIAVDDAGHRLGQGGGFYDRTLAALRTAGPVLVVGVGWDMQVIDAVPVDPWDAPLDALATPSGWRGFARPSMSRR